MAQLTGPSWVADKLHSSGFTLVDPRRPMKYLSGHLPGAINLPAYKAFGADGKLMPPDALAQFIGGAGLGDASTPVLYDSPDGQNAAMVAWILEYLGRTDVHLMDTFFERWKADGREVLYKPVEAAPQRFTPKLNPAIRAMIGDVRDAKDVRLVDFRSVEEFDGERAMGEDRPGHIPGARNLVWRELAAPPESLLAPREKIERLLVSAGVARGDLVVAYCRSGPRASLGYLALKQLGYEVRLFDGSFAEWSQAGLPVEK